MHVSELFSEEDLLKAIEDKMVTKRKHPQFDLWIYNYTPAAQYSRTWNDVTVNCRGLILDGNADIVARPFKKFFNYGEEQVDLAPDTPVKAFDKADGSLGIIYPTPDGKVSVATRGSFESDQALWATDHLKDKGITQDDFMNFDKYTYLCEIVGSFNRIVLDYGDFEGLIGLACVDIETGVAIDPLSTFAFDRYIQHFPEVKTLKDALEVEPRKNAEGLVLRMEDGSHLKIKQADYQEAHRLVSDLSEKRIWEWRLNNPWESHDLIEYIAPLPDEFHSWAQEVDHNLKKKYDLITSKATKAYENARKRMAPNAPRKEFAEIAKESGFRVILFLMLDGRTVHEAIMNGIKPKG